MFWNQQEWRIKENFFSGNFFSKSQSLRRSGQEFFLSVGARGRKEVKNILSIVPPWLLIEHFTQAWEKKLTHGNFKIEVGIWKKF